LGLNRKIPLHNHGTPTRNWLHAKDTASGVVKIIESGETNQIYNIAGGFEQSNIDTVKKIIDVYYNSSVENYEDFIDFSVVRPGQDLRYALNDDKLRNLGWEPTAVFDEEIISIVEYYKQNFIW
jgi:dTDP-D-glucose 4,6-dehydratase